MSAAYDTMDREALLAALKDRDDRIATLETRKATSSSIAPVFKKKAPVVSPDKAKASADQLRKLAARGIKRQMTWKKSCKHSVARFSWSSLCDEATFRAFMGIKGAEKTKGRRVKIDDFEEMLDTPLVASIRYGSLHLRGENVNVTYTKDGEIKVTGSYGM